MKNMLEATATGSAKRGVKTNQGSRLKTGAGNAIVIGKLAARRVFRPTDFGRLVAPIAHSTLPGMSIRSRNPLAIGYWLFYPAAPLNLPGQRRLGSFDRNQPRPGGVANGVHAAHHVAEVLETLGF
jgi:hypothetical protein